MDLPTPAASVNTFASFSPVGGPSTGPPSLSTPIRFWQSLCHNRPQMDPALIGLVALACALSVLATALSARVYMSTNARGVRGARQLAQEAFDDASAALSQVKAVRGDLEAALEQVRAEGEAIERRRRAAAASASNARRDREAVESMAAQAAPAAGVAPPAQSDPWEQRLHYLRAVDSTPGVR